MQLDHRMTTVIETDCPCRLYVEAFNGLYLSGNVSEYLSDSTHFRIYIGTYQQPDEFFSYECSGDSVFVSRHIKVTKIDSISKAGKKVEVEERQFEYMDLRRDSIVSRVGYDLKRLRNK